jgi:hypothetical protein
MYRKYNLLLQQPADQSNLKSRISELEILLEQSQSKVNILFPGSFHYAYVFIICFFEQHRSALETYYAAKVQWDQERSELQDEIDTLRQANQHVLDDFHHSQKQVQSAAAEKGNLQKQEEDAKLQVLNS